MQSQDRELFSEKVAAGKRTYFIDLKEKLNGDRLLKITESRKNDGDFIRTSIMIYQEDFDKFFEALERVKKNM